MIYTSQCDYDNILSLFYVSSFVKLVFSFDFVCILKLIELITFYYNHCLFDLVVLIVQRLSPGMCKYISIKNISVAA